MGIEAAEVISRSVGVEANAKEETCRCWDKSSVTNYRISVMGEEEVNNYESTGAEHSNRD